MAIYALYIRFTDNEERRLATRPVHREYLKTLHEAGKMIEGGPFTDDTGAIIVYEVESKEAAEAQFAQDPYSITGGIVESVTFHEWNRVFAPKV
ncbi:MAG TPA: YciI family protein [Thermomicrobiales bacterium]|nr:YciI family protein [Thermomicrobiales bacterium]